MIITLLNRVPALALLIGAVVLLQIHSIAWWSEYDSQTGWLWAMVIEAGAVWLWAARHWYCNLIAVFATALALIVPLSELAQPVLDDHRQAQSAADSLPERMTTQIDRIASLEASLTQYNANVWRKGMDVQIAATQAQLDTAYADLYALQHEQQAPAPTVISVWLPLGMQLIGVVLLQFLVVLTTRRIFAPVYVDPVIKSRDDEESAPAGEAAEGFSGDSHLPEWLASREAQREQATRTAQAMVRAAKPTALHPAQDAAATSLP